MKNNSRKATKAALNLDKNGKLFELDLWRVDFNPLMTLPLDESAYY